VVCPEGFAPFSGENGRGNAENGERRIEDKSDLDKAKKAPAPWGTSQGDRMLRKTQKEPA